MIKRIVSYKERLDQTKGIKTSMNQHDYKQGSLFAIENPSKNNRNCKTLHEKNRQMRKNSRKVRIRPTLLSSR